MRKTDIEAIKIAVTLAKTECDEHKLCKNCRLYRDFDCELNKAPAHWDIQRILECFT